MVIVVLAVLVWTLWVLLVLWMRKHGKIKSADGADDADDADGVVRGMGSFMDDDEGTGFVYGSSADIANNPFQPGMWDDDR
jgi:hypothetical protein